MRATASLSSLLPLCALLLLLLPVLVLGNTLSVSPCVGRAGDYYGSATYLVYDYGGGQTDIEGPYTASSSGPIDTLFALLSDAGQYSSLTVALLDSIGKVLASSAQVHLQGGTPSVFPISGPDAFVTQGAKYSLRFSVTVRHLAPAHHSQ